MGDIIGFIAVMRTVLSLQRSEKLTEHIEQLYLCAINRTKVTTYVWDSLQCNIEVRA